MTSKLDEELERLSRSIAQEVVPYDAHSGYASPIQEHSRHAAKEAIRHALRTGQLVPAQSSVTVRSSSGSAFTLAGEVVTAQPSGDVVEAVALAILNSDRGMRGLDPLESREHVPDSDGYVTNATAAITTYEAVSGVAKMREDVDRDEAFCDIVWSALKGDHNDLRRQQIILRAFRAALGEKP